MCAVALGALIFRRQFSLALQYMSGCHGFLCAPWKLLHSTMGITRLGFSMLVENLMPRRSWVRGVSEKIADCLIYSSHLRRNRLAYNFVNRSLLLPMILLGLKSRKTSACFGEIFPRPQGQPWPLAHRHRLDGRRFRFHRQRGHRQ